MLTIIASMERELSGLRRGISSVQSGDSLQQSHSLELRVVGVGKSQSRTGLRKILSSRSGGSPREILMLGFAGAVNPELKTGDLVLSSRYYLDTKSDDFLSPDTAMRLNAIVAATSAGLRVSHLDSLSVDRIIETPEAKVVLAENYPVGIVGMEDFWLAAAARDAGVPFLSARVVLDTADQKLPGHLPGLSRGRALDLLRTAAMPWLVPALFGLAVKAHTAQQTLARFALSFIRQWEIDGRASTAAFAPGALAELDR